LFVQTILASSVVLLDSEVLGPKMLSQPPSDIISNANPAQTGTLDRQAAPTLFSRDMDHLTRDIYICL
jgi:hypothetical protein